MLETSKIPQTTILVILDVLGVFWSSYIFRGIFGHNLAFRGFYQSFF